MLAFWLRRRGWRVTVVGRSSALRAGDGGHAVDLFGPAVEVVARRGLEDQVYAARTRTHCITLFRPGGRPPLTVATADLVTGIADRHVEIMRAGRSAAAARAWRSRAPTCSPPRWAAAQAMRLLPHLPKPVRRRVTSFGGGPAAMPDGLILPAAP